METKTFTTSSEKGKHVKNDDTILLNSQAVQIAGFRCRFQGRPSWWSGRTQKRLEEVFPFVATTSRRVGTTFGCVGTTFGCVGTTFGCVGTTFGCVGTTFRSVGTIQKTARNKNSAEL